LGRDEVQHPCLGGWPERNGERRLPELSFPSGAPHLRDGSGIPALKTHMTSFSQMAQSGSAASIAVALAIACSAPATATPTVPQPQALPVETAPANSAPSISAGAKALGTRAAAPEARLDTDRGQSSDASVLAQSHATSNDARACVSAVRATEPLLPCDAVSAYLKRPRRPGSPIRLVGRLRLYGGGLAELVDLDGQPGALSIHSWTDG
jgi:hypothetical protein